MTGWGYPTLLVLLLLTFVVQPWASRSTWGTTALQFLYPVLLVGSLAAVAGKRRVVGFSLLLLLPALVFSGISGYEGSHPVMGDLFGSAFLCVVIASILRDILTRDRITLSSVFGALDVYLLLGVLWTLLYRAADVWLDGAFAGLVDDIPTRGAQLFYFSFVTLTTLGYGDVTPTRPETMSLAAVQAIVGQLYLAALVASVVARLVGGRARAE